MKILLLEDCKSLTKIIKEGLEKENYQVDCFSNGDKALNVISNGYNCFILDINLPSTDRMIILKNIKDYCGNIPVIIISSNHELENIKTCYEKGCSDYIKKPFFVYELVQKIKNICQIKNKKIKFNDEYKYCFIDHILYRNEKKIVLAKKEILFLELFRSNIHRIVNYEEIELYVWEGEITKIDNIRALIKRVRKKLPPNSINIVTGLGYTLSSNISLDK